jgi:hypothetical protein
MIPLFLLPLRFVDQFINPVMILFYNRHRPFYLYFKLPFWG